MSGGTGRSRGRSRLPADLGLDSRTLRLWSKPKADAFPKKPPRHPCVLHFKCLSCLLVFPYIFFIYFILRKMKLFFSKANKCLLHSIPCKFSKFCISEKKFCRFRSTYNLRAILERHTSPFTPRLQTASDIMRPGYRTSWEIESPLESRRSTGQSASPGPGAPELVCSRAVRARLGVQVGPSGTWKPHFCCDSALLY